MRRRWNQLSLPDDRWTFGTWCLFVGLLAFYGGGLWLITGWGPGWLNMTGTCFRGVFESVPPRMQLTASIVALCIGIIVVVTPIAIALIPTLATLLWIMRRAKRLHGGPEPSDVDLREVMRSYDVSLHRHPPTPPDGE